MLSLLTQQHTDRMSVFVNLNGVCRLKAASVITKITGSSSVILHPDGALMNRKHKILSNDTKEKKVRKVKSISNSTIAADESSSSIAAATKERKERKLNSRKVRGKVYAWQNTLMSNERLHFITITFPLATPDGVAYKALNTWLTGLRQADMVSNYLWVAERQKNDTLHYHMLVDCYFNIKVANKRMRDVLNGLRKKKLLLCSKNVISSYNGVDIAKDRKTKKVTNFNEQGKTKNLRRYITKYISKNKSTSKNSLWHCSRSISALMLSFWLSDSEEGLLTFLESFCSGNILYHEFFDFNLWKEEPPDCVSTLLRSVNRTIWNYSLYDDASILLPVKGVNIPSWFFN